jgi:hypothetical protein
VELRLRWNGETSIIDYDRAAGEISDMVQAELKSIEDIE